MIHQRPLYYVEMPPAPRAAHLVATYWGFTVHALPRPGFVHRVWPDGCVTLVIGRLPDRQAFSVVMGPRTSALEVPIAPGDIRWGIRFRPEAGARCCGRDAADMRNTVVDAHTIFPDSIDRLLDLMRDASGPTPPVTAFDDWLTVIAPQASVTSLASQAVDLIVESDGTRPITDIATHLGVSLRHLQRTFVRATGLTPKEYANVRRARAAVKRLASDLPAHIPSALARVAAESGYADQSHLTRECRRLLSLSPTALATLLDDIAHHHLID